MPRPISYAVFCLKKKRAAASREATRLLVGRLLSARMQHGAAGRPVNAGRRGPRSCRNPPNIHSFPTRRSSDLRAGNTDVLTDAEENVRQKLRAEGVM